MSMEQPPNQVPPRKPGMSTTTKVLLILLIVFGGLFLLCCGGGFYWWQQQEMTEDPERIRELTRQIAEIEIPGNFEPNKAMSVNVFVVEMKMAFYKPAETEGMLVLGEFTGEAIGQAQLRQSIEQQDTGRELQIQSTETREFTIRGKTVEFRFAEAEARETGTAYRQIQGTFPTEDGTGYLLMQIPEEHYDEEAVVQMIESIGPEDAPQAAQ